MPGDPGFREEVKQCIAPVVVLVSANFWLSLPPDSSRWSADISFPSAVLARRAAIPAKGLEEAGEREPHSSQTPVADAVQVYLALLRRFFHQSWTAPCLCSLPPAYSSPCAIKDGLPQLHLFCCCSWLIVDPLISPMQNCPPVCKIQPKFAFNIILFSNLVYRVVPVGPWGSASVEAANGRRGKARTS